MNNIQRLTNEGLLEEYLHYQTLADNLDYTAHSDYYIKCTLDRLDVLRKEVLKRMGGNR